MVKVSIRDYMPPYTSWMQVELEGGVCGASAEMKNPGTTGINSQEINTNFGKDNSGEYYTYDTGDDWR